MNAFDPALFAVTAPCMPCCASAECACALLIPYAYGTTTPAADYATAAALVSDPLKVQCYGYQGNSSNPDTFTVTPGTNSLELDYTVTPWNEYPMIGAVSVNAGDTISIVTSGTGGGSGGGDSSNVSVYIYDCAGNQVYFDQALPGPSGSFSYPVTTDGVYYVIVYFAGGVFLQPGFTHGNAVITATTLVPNPVIALWDDSGTTRQLEACPKLLLPILTESTGDWYADCAAAASVISAQVSNCVGYIAETSFASFTATDGGSSLTLDVNGLNDGINPPSNDLNAWGSVNAVAGDSISIAFTFSSTGFALPGGFSADIYDDTGTLVESFSGGTGSTPFVSAALPYTGRYIVHVHANALLAPSATFSTVFVITSSGTLTVNPVQALFDVGLDCPARLSCGDSC